jgi:hypothetical protein
VNRDDRRILRRAAKMLLVNAALARDGCETGDGRLWACPDCPRKPCHAQRAHDAHVRTAGQLKAMARGA